MWHVVDASMSLDEVTAKVSLPMMAPRKDKNSQDGNHDRINLWISASCLPLHRRKA